MFTRCYWWLDYDIDSFPDLTTLLVTTGSFWEAIIASTVINKKFLRILLHFNFILQYGEMTCKLHVCPQYRGRRELYPYLWSLKHEIWLKWERFLFKTVYLSVIFLIASFFICSLNVALFRIGSKLTLSNHISPICVPKEKSEHYLTTTNVCFTVGWGTAASGDKNGIYLFVTLWIFQLKKKLF